jgi:hypothetical protein
MNTLSLLIAALAMLPGVGVGVLLWAWRTYARSDLRLEAGLEQTDLHIGTWPSSQLGSVT